MQEGWKAGKEYFQNAVNAIPRENSAFHERADEICKQLMEEIRAENKGAEAKYVRLSRILSRVEEIQKGNSGNTLEGNPFAYCPIEILRDISGSEENRDGRK